MQLVRRQFLRFAGSALVTSTLPSMARAQAYPARPIRLIVPYAGEGIYL
jgi:tripartite-type tricarboxylate transporter receptor subunit TctC